VVAGHLTNMKNAADPMAAQAGVVAALMARQGITGPVEVIEGKEGLVEVLREVEWHPERLLEGLGEEFIITDCSYKAFPTEALTHQPISAALSLRGEHAIQPEAISEVLVETTTRGADILSDPSKYHPETKETADHSLPYVIAAALADGHVLPESFSEEKLRDVTIRDLLGKIKVVADEEIDDLFPGIKRARVTIITREGERFSKETDVAKGAPEDPLSDAELEAKFRANARGVLSDEQQDRAIEATWGFDEQEDVGEYMRIFVTSDQPKER
jgi:2-methylcitrate dehydratase